MMIFYKVLFSHFSRVRIKKLQKNHKKLQKNHKNCKNRLFFIIQKTAKIIKIALFLSLFLTSKFQIRYRKTDNFGGRGPKNPIWARSDQKINMFLINAISKKGSKKHTFFHQNLWKIHFFKKKISSIFGHFFTFFQKITEKTSKFHRF